jgi:hypothetical protein
MIATQPVPGLIPNPTDDDEPLDHPFVLPSDSGDDTRSRGSGCAEEVNPEDQKVKDALDQSMVSTLSTSRSGSFGRSSMTSPRPRKDIRLSFPDPIASTTDDIRRSYKSSMQLPLAAPVLGATPAAIRGLRRLLPSQNRSSDSGVSSTQELSPRDYNPFRDRETRPTCSSSFTDSQSVTS